MPKPQVTITLGRTGQKVVKRPQMGSDRSQTDSQPISGSKRSTNERVRTSADGSLLPTNKRLRGNLGAYGPGYNRVHDARIGRNDLRLKLRRKELLKRIQSEVEERKKMDLRKKMSRSIRTTERSLLRRTSPTNGAAEMMQAESTRKYYPFYPGAALKARSPERVLKVSQEISPLGHIDELWGVPSTRPSDVSRTGRILESNAWDPSRMSGPAPVTMRATHNSGKPIAVPPPASGLPNTSYSGEQPLTVSSLLHSLGLGKYVILFQAEEVDMAALKQMRDNDLKELGIPMGPRKKILVALLSCSKRQPF